MDSSESHAWCELDEIYNQKQFVSTSEGGGSAENIHCSKLASTRVSNICHIDDFPFIRSALYTKITSGPTLVPVVNRSYEEAHMVECVGHDDACQNGVECECFRLFGFIMTRFIVPSCEHSTVCILCHRINVLQLFLDTRAAGVIPTRSIQPYRNIIGAKHEYDIEDCICMGSGSLRSSGPIIEPFVLHARHKYSAIQTSGGYKVLQTGYSDNKNSDFRQRR